MARKDMRLIIQALRHAKHWSQRTLAAKAKVSQTHIAMIEAGDRTPSLAVLRRLAKAFGRPVAKLLG